jgi:predicted AlkP superfamily phosphohydrolase/phosphomutase
LPTDRKQAVRTLGSIALAATLVAGELALLVLHLNPRVDPPQGALGLLAAVFLPYLLVGCALFALVAGLAWVLRFWPASAQPPIRSLPWFTTLAFVAASLGALLYSHNLLSYRYSVPEEGVRALAASAMVLALAALVLLAVGLDVLLFPLRERGPSAAFAVLAAAACLVLPLALLRRPLPPTPPVPFATETVAPTRRVILIGVDGLGPRQLREGIAAGRLPALARMVREGAFGPLATLRPTEGPPVWTSVVTGRFPRDHGVMSFDTYRLLRPQPVWELMPKAAFVGLLERSGLAHRLPVTSAARRKPALWDALNAFGIPAGVVRLWATHPVAPIRGFMLSPYFHLLHAEPGRLAECLHPAELATEVEARVVAPDAVDPRLLAEFVDFSVELPDDAVPWRRDLVEHALAPDLTYLRASQLLRSAYDPPFFALYYHGLEVVGHGFLRFARPEAFGDVKPGEVRRYGQVFDHYLAWLDARIGEQQAALRPDEILLVVSGHGMEPVPLWRRWLTGAVGGEEMTGTHEWAPDGVLLALGDGVQPRATIEGASVLDVTPSILYLMGLPVGRDMEGRVLGEMLEPGFARSHPITFVPGYESLAVTPRSEAEPEPLPRADVPE